jgi:aminoglycoside phosphotransferase (APT) family kinase protein
MNPATQQSSQSIGTPAAEVAIDEALVRTLLRAQHPDLAELPLKPIDSGWDNVMFRLGDRLAVRMPRRYAAAALVQHEQDWLPTLAPRLPLPISAPVRVGIPGSGYPWRWNIVPWLTGVAADLHPPRADQATRLAAFFDALHVEAPPGAPHNMYRGVPLSNRADAFADRMRRLETRAVEIDPAIRHLWDEALATPIDVAPTWIHGDFHARNVLVDDGAISGIIDWGDIAAGDRATDLVAIWMLFDDPADRRAAMRGCRSVSDATWSRAKGWAVLFGVLLLATGLVDHPRHAAIGERTLHRVVEGP